MNVPGYGNLLVFAKNSSPRAVSDYHLHRFHQRPCSMAEYRRPQAVFVEVFELMHNWHKNQSVVVSSGFQRTKDP